jgi:hypothetical protein
MNRYGLWVLTLLLARAMQVGAAEVWRSYEVYQPRIESYFVVDTDAQELKYNHCSSIAWFHDRWFCLWNANHPPAEGKPGQLNYQSTSRDGRTWSPPEPAFSDERRNANPIPCPKGSQWQPNLIVVKGELWAVWCQNSRDDHNGCYVSRLADPDGKWVNRRLEWDAAPTPKMDGKSWRIFPTQNPIRLRSGRVLAPVTLMGPPAADAPPMIKSWWASEKRDSVLYTDDGGKTWQVSPGAVQPKRTWAQWEPTVWELADGTLMMFARNNDFRGRPEDGPRPSEMLLWSKSADGGATWTAHEYVPLETVASRMHVLPAGGNRYMMVHNDWPAGRFVGDRNNLALFFNRGSGINFVAGPGLTGLNPGVMYPQMFIQNNAAAISYSEGVSGYRSIKVVHVSPLPDPNRYFLFPRNNEPASPRPARVGDAYRFDGHQLIATRAVVDPGADSFSVGAWVRPERGGVLLDTRSAAPAGGFVIGIKGGRQSALVPFISLGTPENNLFPSVTLPSRKWSYLGLTVDGRNGEITFFVNGLTEKVKFKGPVPRPLRGATGHLGAKRLEQSGLSGLTGDLRMLALYPAVQLSAEQHHWIHNAFAKAFGLPALEPAAAPASKPSLWFDPADTAGLERDFLLPADLSDRVEDTQVNGRPALRFWGEASAGVDLDENERARGDRAFIKFRFKIERGDAHILCTVGDANQPARLVARSGEVRLHAGEQDIRCGSPRPRDWTEVEVVSGGEETIARIDGGQTATVRHHPAATWVYFGQGYRTGSVSPENCFLLDVGSVGSRIERGSRH